ncbi:hypothetical protein M433DRAFT_76055 [Acidomyces richmondensis BFW]|nr:MAG: hypothetical protein FE78DRAFT_141848 [Acidomyces sp. 'richmondensis']KYG41337.1 hypothetical protein M433DRAFT_76055 [Acidomyces richmondensis BFW]
MNNNQFRKLVLEQASRGEDDNPSSGEALVSAAPASSLGGKKVGFMPMTPRNVRGRSDNDFARQFRERNAEFQPRTKFKSSTPKGVNYGPGHMDRAKMRGLVKGEEEEEEGSKASRIKALEEQMKLGQIPVETFEALRDEITGGHISNTHLVKGLDRKLLERVRRGENVLELEKDPAMEAATSDLDEQLDKLGEREVEQIKREKTDKKGITASPTALIGRKRTRDEIMAELKAQREAARQSKASVVLGDRWRKVGEQRQGKIEVDHKGREVLITIDEDGVVKKKVRKRTSQSLSNPAPEVSMSLSAPSMLGPDVDPPKSEVGQKATFDEGEDEDIFEGVGREYNPIGDEEDDASVLMEKSDLPNAKRNYFNDDGVTEESGTKNLFVGIQNVLTKAAKLDSYKEEDGLGSDDEFRKTQEARRQKRAEMLAQHDRDLEDMEMGFGSSRFEDDEDAESNNKVRLSQWKDPADCDGGWGEEDGRSKAPKSKRRPKKRKGDVNNAADIMRLIEARKVEK